MESRLSRAARSADNIEDNMANLAAWQAAEKDQTALEACPTPFQLTLATGSLGIWARVGTGQAMLA